MIESSIRKGQQAACDHLLSILEKYKSLTPEDTDSPRSSGDLDREEQEDRFCPDELSLPEQEQVTDEQGAQWDEPPQVSEESDSAEAIYVWELQRRVTLFSDHWRAPFLPHDTTKRARWVDGNYMKHPCITQSRQCCAQSDTPPVDAAPGMSVESMQVVERSEERR